MATSNITQDLPRAMAGKATISRGRGAARGSPKEFVHFRHICRGSASEIDTQLEVAARLGYVSPEQKGGLDEKLDKISKMLSGLIRSVRTRDS